MVDRAMDIACEVCGSRAFYSRDGRTICQQCHTESQEHGLETVVSDETIGIFSGLPLHRRTVKEAKKKKVSAVPCAFKTTDAFTCVLRGWVDEAVALGAKPTLKHLVFTLWARYLQSQGMAFAPDGIEPGLGPVAAYRDLQMAITPNKKLITGAHKSRLRNARMSKASADKDSSDEMDALDMSREVKRKRARKRRKFFKALAGESDVTTDSDSSNHSFASIWSCNSSVAEDSNSSFSFSQTASTSSMGELEEDRNGLIARSAALDNLNKKNRLFDNMSHLRMTSVFSCFALGVLLNDDNEFTLSDLVYWARSDALSYRTAAKHLLPEMELRGREDFTRFQPEDAPSVNAVRAYMQYLVCTLGLKMLKLNEHDTMSKVLKRQLRELSLPAALMRVITKTFKEVPEALRLVQYFSTTPPNGVSLYANMITPDTRSISIILFVLKFLYGLDDVSEEFYSSSARKFNTTLKDNVDQETMPKKKFVFCDWLRLSRRRAFVAARHSHLLHSSMASLFPGVELCDEEIVNAAHHRSEQLIQMNKSNKNFNRFYSKSSKTSTSGLKVLLEDMMESSLPIPRRQIKKLDIAASLTPLLDFSSFVVNDADCDMLSESDRSSISSLLDMTACDVDYCRASCGAERVELDVPWNFAPHFISLRKEDRHTLGLSHRFVDRKQTALPEQDYFVKPQYWILHNSKVHEFSRAFHSPDSVNRLLSVLPENFRWILEYLSAVSSVPASEIYADLMIVETMLIATNRGLFRRVNDSSHSLQ